MVPLSHVGAFGPLRMHAGQPGAGAARVIAVRRRSDASRLVLRQAADDDQLIRERRQRRQDRRQLEVAALALRLPVVHAGDVHRHAVRHVDEPQAATGLAAASRRRRQRRHHRVEQRQRQRDAQAAQERPPRQRHLGDDHRSRPSCPFVSAGSSHLKRRALDDAQDERRREAVVVRGRASRTIARTAGAS